MSKQAKIEAIRNALNPRLSPVLACSVKHYTKGEEPQPGDPFTVDHVQLTLKEVEQLPGRNIVVTIVKERNHDETAKTTV